MDFVEDIVWRIREFLSGGRWMWIVVAGVLLVVAAIPASLLWPVIRPKPEPRLQPIPSGVSTAQSQTPTGILPAVPKDVVDEIASKLGVEAGAALSVAYTGDVKHIRATRSLGGMKFKTYQFVQRENGTWAQQ